MHQYYPIQLVNYFLSVSVMLRLFHILNLLVVVQSKHSVVVAETNYEITIVELFVELIFC